MFNRKESQELDFDESKMLILNSLGGFALTEVDLQTRLEQD